MNRVAVFRRRQQQLCNAGEKLIEPSARWRIGGHLRTAIRSLLTRWKTRIQRKLLLRYDRCVWKEDHAGNCIRGVKSTGVIGKRSNFLADAARVHPERSVIWIDEVELFVVSVEQRIEP